MSQIQPTLKPVFVDAAVVSAVREVFEAVEAAGAVEVAVVASLWQQV